MKWISFFSVIVFSLLVIADDSKPVLEEENYNKIYSRILAGETLNQDYESPYFLKALSEAFANGLINKSQLKNEFEIYNKSNTEADEILSSWTFRNEFPQMWSKAEQKLESYIGNDPRIIHLKNRDKLDLRVNREDLARDLIDDQPNMGVLRLYMFCRNDRIYPCLFLARNKNGKLVKEGSEVWHQPSLAFSRHGKMYNEFNGNTPSGVYTIEGVMPYPNGQEWYGKFRRLIMEFIPATKDESAILNLLPPSSQTEDWWQESVVARDMGRSALRIHGTGQVAPVGEPYYPFYGTSGCIAQRENTYDGIEYVDQRKLLDKLMLTLGLRPVYENETKIEALLYVININNEKRAVSFEDLQELNIVKEN